MAFNGRVLVLGCGSVSQCTLPLLLGELKIPGKQITVLDMVDNRERIKNELKKGVTYVVDHITPESMDPVLSNYVGEGDILIDLAWNIDCCEILDWCRSRGVRYLNTSVELWDPYAGAENKHPLERTLYVRHMAMRRQIARWGDNKGATAVVEHGANPGLVSHFTKWALCDISDRLLADGKAKGKRRKAIEAARGAEDYPTLAQILGVKTIHISERDTQITKVPKQVDEFVNTWSIEGFYEEGVAPAELGWGTHELRMPAGAYQHAGHGPGNQICLPQMGCKTWVRSWVPLGEITGMVIRHGEAFTISDHLTVWDDGQPVYRPTVHYAYCPADVAIVSLHELEMRQFELQEQQRILNDEIVSGADVLGVLLMGHDYKCWWTGSMLSIEETRALVKSQNATTLQVAASVVGAIKWMMANPNEGVRVPDELPWREVLGVANKYLGTMHSGASDWDPVSTRRKLYAGYDGRDYNTDDVWQFTNFLVSENAR
ncbi:MAG: saccharopine dehydrogenase C-terminal domain-containing protein [Acidimicrobiia bacterium]